MRKKGQVGFVGLLVIAIVVVVGLGMVLGSVKLPFSTGNVVNNGANACLGGETQSLDLQAYDKDTKTLLTEANNAYRVVGDSVWKSFTQDTAITTLNAGDDVEVVYGVDSDSEAGNAYGPYKVLNNIACTQSVETEVQNDEVATSLTATFYNDDNNAAAMTTVNTAGQSGWSRLKWVAGSNEVFGNPYMETYTTAIADDARHRPKYPNCLCMNLNTTNAAAPEVKFNGVTMNRISAPLLFSGTADHTSYCYEAPVVTDDPTDIMVRFEAKSGGDGMDVDKTATLYAGGAYVHSEEGELYWGCSTDDSQYVGAAAADTLTLDFTA